MLKFLYDTFPGRVILKTLTKPAISKMCGAFLETRLSKVLIPPFVYANAIDLSECFASDFKCFNDCFARRMRPGKRVFDMNPSAFCAPCDGLLTVYEITPDLVISVKHSRYDLVRLLHSRKLADRYAGGYCLVFRLCVDNYHRYSYIDKGSKGVNHFIPGKLHTVQPIALERVPVFTENSREFTVMNTENFGKIVQMEVGAMLVGKIHNHHGRHNFLRGQEKGFFKYGGSTIIVLVEKGRVVLDDKILKASAEEVETPVKLGEKIGNGWSLFRR